MSYYEYYREVIELRGKLYDMEKEALRLMKENTRLKEALQAIAFGVWIEGELQEGQYRGKQQHEIARSALEGE
jgi:hypothetical protein